MYVCVRSTGKTDSSVDENLCVFGKNVKWLQNMTGGDVGPRVGERWQFALMISSVSRVDIFCASSCGWTSTSQQCLNDYVWTIIEQWHLSALQLSASSETSERHSTFPNALQCCKVAFCNVDREAKEAHSGPIVESQWSHSGPTLGCKFRLF